MPTVFLSNLENESFYFFWFFRRIYGLILAKKSCNSCCLSGESRLTPLGFKTGRESFPSSGSSTMQCLSCILRFVSPMRSLITPLSQLNHQFLQLLPMNLMTFIPNRSGWFITFFTAIHRFIFHTAVLPCYLSGEDRSSPLGSKTGRESFPSSGSSVMRCLSCTPFMDVVVAMPMQQL